METKAKKSKFRVLVTDLGQKAQGKKPYSKLITVWENGVKLNLKEFAEKLDKAIKEIK